MATGIKLTLRVSPDLIRFAHIVAIFGLLTTTPINLTRFILRLEMFKILINRCIIHIIL